MYMQSLEMFTKEKASREVNLCPSLSLLESSKSLLKFKHNRVCTF